MPSAKVKEEPNDEAPPATETSPPPKPNDKTLPPSRAQKAKVKSEPREDRPRRRAPHRSARGSDHRDEAPDEWASDADTNRFSDDEDDSGSEYAPDEKDRDFESEDEEGGDDVGEEDDEESRSSKKVKKTPRKRKAEKPAAKQPARKSRRTTRSSAKSAKEKEGDHFKDEHKNIKTEWDKDIHVPNPEEYTYDAPAPTRDEKTGVLKFEGFDDFSPNLTPAEVLQLGSFGGTYYRPIHSAITSQDLADDYKLDLPDSWLEGLDPSKHLTSAQYHTNINRYGSKCGLTLEEWERSGWITVWDPRGWFQWYVRFYRGRRCDDDKRQISRWKKCAHERSGRWLRVYLGKCLKAELDHIPQNPKEEKVSPVIRQVLQHWGLAVNDDVYERFKAEKGKK
ncbi:hypothetical protein HK097_001118 [Rhizophlyctis rosea]|uniref:Uncharacterized protein n=1 Tax=Rhizophlyctis rosea TaxID=64517 RepID=A0AAD5X0Z8_9FUNG|nr:hypothetical protein HK097_001118 [Rhizophlyctis rosea]